VTEGAAVLDACRRLRPLAAKVGAAPVEQRDWANPLRQLR